MVESGVRVAQPRDTVQVMLPGNLILEGPLGTTVETFLRVAFPHPPTPYMVSLVDGKLRELTYAIKNDCTVEPLDLSQSDGVRVYRRSLSFLMVAAAHEIFPGVEIFVDHSLPFGGYFCEVRDREPFTDVELQALSAEMWRMVEADYPITRTCLPLEEALEIFRGRGEMDKMSLFQRREGNKKTYLQLYGLDTYQDYFHGYMVPSTGYLKYFRLLCWENGFILQFPRRHQPTQLQPIQQNPQLLSVFREYGQWLRLLGTESVGELNEIVEHGELKKTILVSEALHEHRIADIADQIQERRDKVRVVLVAGPSSSGKTTFSKRLGVQLLAHGIRPLALELDNYFHNREDTPRDENGDYDFEALEALDITFFNAQLQALLQGDEVQLPKFNFFTGQREVGPTVRLQPGQIVIAEGIHGLNPDLIYALPNEALYRIYVSALTQLNLDRHNRVPTTDTRLIRRITRDARTRGYSAAETIARWESVRRGEKRHIFPYQENADVMFNSALVYELSVLKSLAEPLLLQVDADSRQWIEAKRLLTFLQWFLPAEPDQVPENSILREFIGGSSLEEFHWD
ncbi:MAG TPA: nucleoside kinase [Anaerolineae bacterium]|nr:nucleoside kinase [Anaerolineae bacterium]HQH38380.1 nucleoside kinase [Anaerolineae bacterium]